MDDIETIRSGVRQFLTALLESRNDRAGFSDTDSLVASGRLDSIDTVELVNFLEERYGIDFLAVGFDQGKLESVVEIAGVVEESRK